MKEEGVVSSAEAAGPPLGRSSRVRKAINRGEDFIDSADIHASAMRQKIGKSKPLNKRKLAQEAKHAEQEESGESKSRGKVKPKKDAEEERRAKMTGKEREQDDIEQSVMDRFAVLNENLRQNIRYKQRLLPDGAENTFADVKKAVQWGVTYGTRLLTDWSQPGAEFIGKLCKIYWDGEKQWFYARILYYDSQYHKHLVYYLEDQVAEWVR